MKKRINIIILSILITIFSIGVLSVFVKGKPGMPLQYQYDYNTEVGGPLESSNTTSRYILTEAIVTRGTYLLDEKQARFAAPDVVFYKDKFFSIFTPGISFLAVPFYILGQQFGAPQLFAFFTTLIFAVINVFLVARLSSKFGANKYISLALGLTFLFGTNALAYALTLTQHHYSTTIILLGILNALAAKRTVWNNICFGILFVAGLLFDIPNGFMMLPLVFYILFKHFEITKKQDVVRIFVNPVGFWVVLAMLPLMAFFGYYNYHTAGSPTIIGQNLGQSHYFDSEEKKQERLLKNLQDTVEVVETPFNTRKQLAGFYTLIVSDERGIFYYNAIVIAGILGLLIAYKTRKDLVSLVGSVILINVVLYSAFGDAWGGWSFGPRYLIPACALLVASIGAITFTKNRFKYALIILFVLTLLYSTYINTLGALTTSAIPPKVEAVNLPSPIPHTYKLNMNLVAENKSSSLLFNSNLKNNMSLQQLHLIITGLIFFTIYGLFSYGVFRKDKS